MWHWSHKPHLHSNGLHPLPLPLPPSLLFVFFLFKVRSKLCLTSCTKVLRHYLERKQKAKVYNKDLTETWPSWSPQGYVVDSCVQAELTGALIGEGKEQPASCSNKLISKSTSINLKKKKKTKRNNKRTGVQSASFHQQPDSGEADNQDGQKRFNKTNQQCPGSADRLVTWLIKSV